MLTIALSGAYLSRIHFDLNLTLQNRRKNADQNLTSTPFMTNYPIQSYSTSPSRKFTIHYGSHHRRSRRHRRQPTQQYPNSYVTALQLSLVSSHTTDACNAKGVWGSGVAVEFKKRVHPLGNPFHSHRSLTIHKFPKAYQMYHAHCLAHKTSLVDGTTLLILPQSFGTVKQHTRNRDTHYIACLFTSHGYGKTVDPPETILKNTKAALDNLATQIEKLKVDTPGIEVGECRAVRINSGKFGVPWEKTRRILEEGSLDMVVVRPEGEADGKVEAGKQIGDEGKKHGLDGKNVEEANNQSKQPEKGKQLKIEDAFRQSRNEERVKEGTEDDPPSKRRRGGRTDTGGRGTKYPGL